MRWRRGCLVLSITLTVAAAQAQNLPMPGRPSGNLTAARIFDHVSLPE